MFGLSIGVVFLLGLVPATPANVTIETIRCRAVESRKVACGYSGWWKCTEKRYVTKTCLVDPAVDGGWSEFSNWTLSECSVTCGEGTVRKFRYRTCDSPKPAHGGKDCEGEANETTSVTCQEKPCPIDGGWSAYSKWTDTNCSVSCGGGTFTRSRTRTCDNPEPAYGGKDCKGRITQTVTKTCNTQKCPIDGGWSKLKWGPFDKCSKTCGGGTKHRNGSRECNNPVPKYDGKNCTGPARTVQLRVCKIQKCPVDGGWSKLEWGPFNKCSKTCGSGTMHRTGTRECNNPVPKYGGKRCKGPARTVELRVCKRKKCPVDGGWSKLEWSPFDECSQTCGGGTKHRSGTRECNNPVPTHGGKSCSGPARIVELEVCNSQKCPVDGGWSAYSEWTVTNCSVSCGGGTFTRSRNRTCDNPEPAYGGKDCKGKITQTVTKTCNTQKCPIDGGWSKFKFGPFSKCSKTCGTGTKHRAGARECNNPVPKYGGKSCKGPVRTTELNLCNTQKCPDKDTARD